MLGLGSAPAPSLSPVFGIHPAEVLLLAVPLAIVALLAAGVDRAEHQAVAVVVDDGGTEAQPAAHVAERVVAHHGHVPKCLAEVGTQRGEVGVASRPVLLERGDPAPHLGRAAQQHDQTRDEDHRHREGDRERQHLCGVREQRRVHEAQARRWRRTGPGHSMLGVPRALPGARGIRCAA